MESIPFATALRAWIRIGLLSFGGPAGQIAVMHRILVEEKRWVGEERFLHALNYCMLLPGPEAQQLATYVGWLLHGTRGGLVAGTLFVLPGFLSILALSIAYVAFRDAVLVTAILFGLKPVVMAVVIEAVVRIGKRALHGRARIALAAAAFAALFFLDAPFPAIVLGAGAVGWFASRRWPGAFPAAPAHRPAAAAAGAPVLGDGETVSVRPSPGRTVRVLATGLVLWFGPVLVAASLLGRSSVYVQETLFFSQAAVLTFGGAYAVLAYVAQEAVGTYGWLAPGEMLDGLGMAETTPGPLIMVVQFVGFLAAYRNPGPLTPMVAGVVGSVLTTWVTLVPSMLWIFLGAPYVEGLRGNRNLSAALSAITACVVGVILNLAIWFGLHVLFGTVDEVRRGPLRLLVPDPRTLDPAAAVLAAGAFVAMLRFRRGMFETLGVGVVAGAAWYLAMR